VSGKAGVIAVVAAGLVLAAGAGPGRAAGGGSQPTRDHGRGHWFHRACSLPAAGVAQCDAQVVTDAGGIPLASPTPPAGAYGPTQFHTGYSLPTASAAGTPPTVAIVDAFDDPNAEADLGTYDSNYGLPACTTGNGCFKKVNQTGGTSYPAADSDWALEISLDVQTVRAICQSCHILLVEASSTSLADLGAAENEAAALGANVISNSWGGPEYSTETADDNTYFNHPGVAITVSSGDDGYGVQYPAASKYVTAVGGTTLNLNPDNSYASESAWADGGSGCSAYEPKPAWQADAGCPSKRTVVDVAADHRCGRLRLRGERRPVRLVPGRRHEPRRTARRRRLRPCRQHRLGRQRVGAVRLCRYGLVARRRVGQQRQLRLFVPVHRSRRLRRAHRPRHPARDGRVLTHGRRRVGCDGRVSVVGGGGLEREHADVHIYGRHGRAELGRDLGDGACGLVCAFDDGQRAGLYDVDLRDGRGGGLDDPADRGDPRRWEQLLCHVWLEGERGPGCLGSVVDGLGLICHRREVDHLGHPHRPGRLAQRDRERGGGRVGCDGGVSVVGDGRFER